MPRHHHTIAALSLLALTASGCGGDTSEAPAVPAAAEGQQQPLGATASRPDGWPEGVHAPAGFDGNVVEVSGGSYQIVGTVPGPSGRDVIAQLTTALETDGWTTEIVESTSTTGMTATRGQDRYDAQVVTETGTEVTLMIVLSLQS